MQQSNGFGLNGKRIEMETQNYDLHNITGFYVLILPLFFAITGLSGVFNGLLILIIQFLAEKNH
jgi:hypothetical protein